MRWQEVEAVRLLLSQCQGHIAQIVASVALTGRYGELAALMVALGDSIGRLLLLHSATSRQSTVLDIVLDKALAMAKAISIGEASGSCEQEQQEEESAASVGNFKAREEAVKEVRLVLLWGPDLRRSNNSPLPLLGSVPSEPLLVRAAKVISDRREH